MFSGVGGERAGVRTLSAELEMVVRTAAKPRGWTAQESLGWVAIFDSRKNTKIL
jgi:hypothetical protein